MERFKKLKLKGENVHIQNGAAGSAFQVMVEHLKIIDPDVSLEGLSKLKSEKIDKFLTEHGRCRHYIFQVLY